MAEVSSSVYNADGNVTSATQYPGVLLNDRVGTYKYDWRDRLEYAISPADDQGRVTYAMSYYDNMGRATKNEQYWDDDSDIATAGPEPWSGTTPGNDQILARGVTSYDTLGRAYKSETYAVDPTDATGTAVGD